jgi:hypothetical protein
MNREESSTTNATISSLSSPTLQFDDMFLASPSLSSSTNWNNVEHTSDTSSSSFWNNDIDILNPASDTIHHAPISITFDDTINDTEIININANTNSAQDDFDFARIPQNIDTTTSTNLPPDDFNNFSFVVDNGNISDEFNSFPTLAADSFTTFPQVSSDNRNDYESSISKQPNTEIPWPNTTTVDRKSTR